MKAFCANNKIQRNSVITSRNGLNIIVVITDGIIKNVKAGFYKLL